MKVNFFVQEMDSHPFLVKLGKDVIKSYVLNENNICLYIKKDDIIVESVYTLHEFEKLKIQIYHTVSDWQNRKLT